MLQRGNEGGEHRIGKIRHNDAGELRLARAEPRRAEIDDVTKLAHRIIHAPGKIGRNRWLAVEDVRDRRDRNAGPVGHHLDGRALLSRHLALPHYALANDNMKTLVKRFIVSYT